MRVYVSVCACVCVCACECVCVRVCACVCGVLMQNNMRNVKRYSKVFEDDFLNKGLLCLEGRTTPELPKCFWCQVLPFDPSVFFGSLCVHLRG